MAVNQIKPNQPGGERRVALGFSTRVISLGLHQKETKRPIMKFKSNFVSMLIGTALGVAAVLSIAAVSTDASAYGRFQLLAADTYLFKIDTTTGQVWRTWINSPTKEFMAPNIGKTNSPAPNAATTNPEKSAEK
jgi:hypothetical protein